MRKYFKLALLCLMSGCATDTSPTAPDFTASFVGNYQAIADCSFLKIREKYADWRKDDFPSMQKSQMTWGAPNHIGGKIDFISTGENQTVVRSYMGRAIWGADYYRDRYLPLIEGCAKQSA